MKNKILIVGSGGFGRVVLEHASLNYDCYFVDDGYKIGELVCNTIVIGHLNDLIKLKEDFGNLIVAIGNNRVRERVYKQAKSLGFAFPNIVSKSVYISPFAKVGCGCVFLNNVVIQNGSVVGNGVLLNPGVEIHHDGVVGDNCLVYTNSVIRTKAKLCDRVQVGSNVTVSNDVIIEADSILEDGCTILK